MLTLRLTIAPLGAALALASCRPRDPAVDREAASAGRAGPPVRPDSLRGVQPLTVRILDVGQGDAVYVTNGTSKVLVDGGPDADRLGHHLDALGLDGATIDVVVISHGHADHYNGLRALFETRRGIRVRYLFENKDVSPNTTLFALRDSINARVRRGQLVYRDTDDPCGDGRAVCTIAMNGGAKLHVMRPLPAGTARGDVSANDRSTPLKLVGPDSASFTMWLAGDAEHRAIAWFDAAGYDVRPGMRAHVLKADHHGSCNGVTARYLDLVRPEWVVVSVGAENTYGHIHTQARATYTRAGDPWYRTDRNGTITIRSPGAAGGGYAVTVEEGTRSMSGAADRRSMQPECAVRAPRRRRDRSPPRP